MILLNNVVAMLHLADFNGCAVLVIILFKSRLVGRTSVNGDFLGSAIVVDCFEQESFGGQFISVRGQQKVNGLAFFVNGSIQIVPFTFDIDLGLIHSPAGANSFLPFPELNFEDRSIFDNPSLNRSVIELNASFFHVFFDITI